MYVLFLQQRIIYPFGLQGVFAGIPQGQTTFPLGFGIPIMKAQLSAVGWVECSDTHRPF